MSAAPTGLRTSGLVLAVAGVVWWLVGTTAPVDGGPALGLLAVGLVVGAVAALAAWRLLGTRGEAEQFERARRLYTVVNVAQGLGILVVVVTCVRLGLQPWIPVGITFVFAVHFLPFGTAFRWRGWTVLAVVLAVVAAGGAALAASGAAAPTVQRTVGLAVAVVLWSGVVGAVLDRPRRRGDDRGAAASGAPAVEA